MTSELARSVPRALFVAAALCLALPSGCGVSSDYIPPLWLGRPGDRLPASTTSNVFWVDASVDGNPDPEAQVIVDTGAPITLLHVEAFHGAVPLGGGRVATMTLGSTTLWKVPTVGDHGDANTLAPNGKVDGGIVGFTVFGQFAMSFDYRDNQVVIGTAPPPPDVEDPVGIPFSLEGGGAGPIEAGGQVIEFPASRVILTGAVEGRPVSFLLDTGASWVALRTGLYQSLLLDGRGQISVEANLAAGTAKTNITRARSVVVGGVEVSQAVVASAAKVDALLDDLSSEVHEDVGGLLGAPFLREFYVTVDYPIDALILRRFATRTHIVDDYRRVGIEVRGLVSPTANAYLVQRVYPGTDAAKQGIKVDEQLVAIDGQPLFTLDIGAVDRKLRGAVGTSRQLQFADRTLDVLIDELLPQP